MLPSYSLEDARAAGAEPGVPERGKTAYTTYCAHCHGPDGRGGEKGGAVVDGAYLALVSDQALRTAVIAGRVDLGMPDWREAVAGQPMTPQESPMSWPGWRHTGSVPQVSPLALARAYF